MATGEVGHQKEKKGEGYTLMRLLTLLLAISASLGFNQYQASTIRALFRDHGVPQGLAAIDSILSGSIAFSEVAAGKSYIDGRRLWYAPNTYHNVLNHEIAHLLGANHGDGSPYMSYSVRIWPNGTVIDDDFVL